MKLSDYEGKHVRLRDMSGNTFTGAAGYCSSGFCLHEYGTEENGIFIGDYLIYESDIASIEEIEAHGTAELWTERMILRRFRPEDAQAMYRNFEKAGMKLVNIEAGGLTVGGQTYDRMDFEYES